MHNKTQYHKLYGHLQQLPIPPQPWKSISTDFIEYLPSSNRFTNILVVMDRLTKQVIFIPTHSKLDSVGLARLFIQYVFLKYRVPIYVTFNQSTKFVFRFFHSLTVVLGMRLYFTSDHYPETDGQTEHTNQSLEQYLYIYYNY